MDKVRDWLVGGLTGLTIAEASNIKSLLGNFAIDGSAQEFALVASRGGPIRGPRLFLHVH